MERSHDELLDRAVKGDESALAELLEQVGVQLHAELEARIGAPYRGLVGADDVLQVTFLEAFLRIRSFVPSGPGAFLSWIRRIGDNNLRDAIRELEREKRPSPAKRVSPTNNDDSYVMLLESIAGSATTASRAASRKEIKGLLDVALNKLPGDYNRVLRLYELEGLSAPEVAEKMGRSHGAVRMLLARARECLSEVLGSESKYL
ncbi:MAG TPA: RNA polymerase sigma factor [Phycisphaerae bacterium]|nr:RNA polymerase sigma factor [Phycisphaerae bacterium]